MSTQTTINAHFVSVNGSAVVPATGPALGLCIDEDHGGSTAVNMHVTTARLLCTSKLSRPHFSRISYVASCHGLFHILFLKAS